MSASLITQLRDIVPLRGLSPNEAFRLAELQASRYLSHYGIQQPAVSVDPIRQLPKVQVRYLPNWPASGTTHWTHAVWSVVINASEPRTRQRFSLAHEFKHILDDRFADIIYPADSLMGEQRLREAVCDYFAGCLLVPKIWLRQAWTSGVQNPLALAARFDVSTAAIDVRLAQLGLTEGIGRHDRRQQSRYYRLGTTAITQEVST